jgi:hypothetical protein
MKKTDHPFTFPPGLPVPEPLQALLRQCPDLFDGQVSGSFSFRAEPPGEAARYFGDAGSPAAAVAARHLGVFGGEPDGSVLAVWRAPQGGFPVVYLSSEGGGRVLAADMAQFLRLLAVGYDEFSLWDSLDSAPEEDGEVSPLLLDWLQARGLAVPDTGEAIVDEAETRWPDFNGWVEDAVEGRLPDTPTPPVATPTTSTAPAATLPDLDLWTQMQACLGERIDAPIVADLLQKLGLKPLKAGTPHNDSTYVSGGGIEVSAEIGPRYRPLFPPRKQGRIWTTYVTRILLEPKSAKKVVLPEPLSWKRFPGDDDTTNHLTQALNERCEIRFLRDDDGTGTERIFIELPQERAYITADADYEREKPLVYVEDAFFATWCALQGLLALARYDAETLRPWQQRERSPLQLLHGPCRRLVWSSDLRPEYIEFMKRYYKGFDAPDSERWVSDIKTAFGSSNHFREADEAMTPDDWASFDRIAPLIAQRFAAWRKRQGA